MLNQLLGKVLKILLSRLIKNKLNFYQTQQYHCLEKKARSSNIWNSKGKLKFNLMHKSRLKLNYRAPKNKSLHKSLWYNIKKTNTTHYAKWLALNIINLRNNKLMCKIAISRRVVKTMLINSGGINYSSNAHNNNSTKNNSNKM